MTPNKSMTVLSQHEVLFLIRHAKTKPEFICYASYILPMNNSYLMVIDCIFRVEGGLNSDFPNANIGWEWHASNLTEYTKDLYTQLGIGLNAIYDWRDK